MEGAKLSQAVTEAESARAVTGAELAQAAVEAVLQASREVRLVTRGDILATLAASGILASVAGAAGDDENEGTDNPRIQKEGQDVPLPTGGNMDAWLTVVLSGHPEVASFESLSGQTVYHSPDLLSRTYALILDRKGSPVELMAEEIRINCRDYPRPVPVELFEAPPFGLSPEEIESALKAMAAKAECKDITFTTASTGAVYLFSTLHMDREYATFLAERAENLAMNP
jgi:hypothetical protein